MAGWWLAGLQIIISFLGTILQAKTCQIFLLYKDQDRAECSNIVRNKMLSDFFVEGGGCGVYL